MHPTEGCRLADSLTALRLEAGMALRRAIAAKRMRHMHLLVSKSASYRTRGAETFTSRCSGRRGRSVSDYTAYPLETRRDERLNVRGP